MKGNGTGDIMVWRTEDPDAVCCKCGSREGDVLHVSLSWDDGERTAYGGFPIHAECLMDLSWSQADHPEYAKHIARVAERWNNWRQAEIMAERGAEA